MARARSAAHEFGELEAVHVRHLDIDQGQGEVVDEKKLQRLLA